MNHRKVVCVRAELEGQILSSLSRYVTRCLVCGTYRDERVKEERNVVWIGCSCGHVFPAKNCNTWH
jgi:translation initiation factor 2 beta subunit (eIF-2beta)/eIF-5